MTLQPLFDYKILLKAILSKKNHTNKILIKSGRLAFNYIINDIKENNNKINKIILPNLICDEIVMIAEYHKIEVKYYNIDNKLNYDINEIEDIAKDENNIIVLVNYFGFVKDHIITQKLKNNFIIEDNAHVLKKINDDNQNPFLDYSFSSLRKLLPVLSGAEVYSSKHKLDINQDSRFPDFGEMKYSLRSLKKSRIGVSKMGHSSNRIDISNYNIDIFSKLIINNYKFSYSQIALQRRKNFIFWESYLKDNEINFMRSININDEICPYAFPCYFTNDEKYNKWLEWGKSRNITIIAWPKYHKDTFKYIPDNFLRRILLFPVNHQFDLNKIIS